jgi:hypothetical protein
MKIVKFIRSLNVEEVPCGERQNMFQYYDHDLYPISYTNLVIAPNTRVQNKIVPIHTLFEWKTESDGLIDKKETYIAISEEVEELLGMPYKSLATRNDFLEKELIKCGSIIAEVNKKSSEQVDQIKKLEERIRFGSEFAVEMFR